MLDKLDNMKLIIDIDSLDSQIIEFYQSNQVHKVKDALLHGYQMVHSPEYGMNLSQIEAQHTQTIQDLKTTIQENKAKYEIQTQEKLDIQKKNYQLQEEILQEQITNLQKNQIQGHIALEKQIKMENQEQIDKLEQKNELLHQKMLDSHLTFQEKIEIIHQQHKEELEKMQNKLDSHNSVLSNSSKKGQIGELRTFDLLNNLFPAAEINDTSQTSANGDFRIVIAGIQILYEHKNFQNNVPKRDIEKFRRDITVSDCDCAIMCSESSGIALKNDLDLEIIGDSQKPCLFLHHTRHHPEKIHVGIMILVNMLVHKIDLNTSTLTDIKNQVKECESILTLYQTNRKHISQLQENNEKLAVHGRRIKNKLDYLIQELSNPGEKSSKKLKEKCEYCNRAYVSLTKHYPNCEKKLALENIMGK